jgi:hypothetical protein
MESALRLGEPEWIRPVGIAHTEAYWLEGRLDAAISELDRVRSFSAGATTVERCWMALWQRRLMVNATHPSARPGSQNQSGVPPRTHRRNWPANPIGQVSLAVRWQPDSLIASVAAQTFTSRPLRQERAVMFAADSASGNFGG